MLMRRLYYKFSNGHHAWDFSTQPKLLREDISTQVQEVWIPKPYFFLACMSGCHVLSLQETL